MCEEVGRPECGLKKGQVKRREATGLVRLRCGMVKITLRKVEVWCSLSKVDVV